ncbi:MULTISPECIES: Dabb family protein [unclassified Brenneria]|uniref:Dabb family protein n=1 Tax=unclassified Brenneria TaxID=2634434 RepID=UPI0029C3F822|nr:MULTISPECIES: Dabb family protein [unclassified Brenneria]MDX5628271.1 Dabb family protein [Brenneria sp. L3-3Z]MDX5695546.1 Dabb family protein [Brenneria sp. L4-2C]MEE3662395.1 Dabb family protein [Brenneria sp. g21c3]
MIRHILLIAFTEKASATEIEQVKMAFLHMTENVEGVQAVEWGCNDSPEGKNAGFTHCVMMTFCDEQARQRYLPHPRHDELKAIFRPVLNDIIVLDYPLLPENHRTHG